MSFGADPRGDVHRDTCDIIAHHFHFARVQACTHFQPERLHTGYNRQRTSNPSTWTVEASHETVPSVVGFASMIAGKLAAHDSVIVLKSALPSAVAERTQGLSRVSDVDEENCCQDPIV